MVTPGRDYDFIAGEVLIIDKPLEWTSFDVVKRLRSTLTRRLGIKKFKVGHAGTLDPLATGVIIVTTGRATKLIDSLQAGVKEYVATLKLGATTPSFDLETEIDATYPTDHITRDMIDQATARFTGRIEQVPPAFSACKVDGKRAYDLARKGREVELKPKVLVIDEIEVTAFDPESHDPHAPHRVQQRHLHPCPRPRHWRGTRIGSPPHSPSPHRVGDATLGSALSVDDAVELIRNCSLAPQPD